MSAGLPRKKVEVITWFAREARSSAVKPSAGCYGEEWKTRITPAMLANVQRRFDQARGHGIKHSTTRHFSDGGEKSEYRVHRPGGTEQLLSANKAVKMRTDLFPGRVSFIGFNTMFLGIIGEYLGRIYNQGKNRRLYLVDEQLKFDATTKSGSNRSSTPVPR
jgi:hypothetical protein